MTPMLCRSRFVALIILLLASSSGTAGSYFAVIVSDIDVSTRWYESTFGLTTLTRFDAADNLKIVNLGKPGVYVELLWLQSATEKPEGRIQGLFKAGLLVDDLDAFIASLPTTEEPPEIVNDTRNLVRLVQLRDPDDNLIQVMELQRAATR